MLKTVCLPRQARVLQRSQCQKILFSGTCSLPAGLKVWLWVAKILFEVGST
jgi:hypothetical protein